MINCNTMRLSVLLSAALFLAGVALLLFSEISGILVPTAHAALFLVVGGAAVLAFAFAIAVLPGNAERLMNCLH